MQSGSSRHRFVLNLIDLLKATRDTSFWSKTDEQEQMPMGIQLLQNILQQYETEYRDLYTNDTALDQLLNSIKDTLREEILIYDKAYPTACHLYNAIDNLSVAEIDALKLRKIKHLGTLYEFERDIEDLDPNNPAVKAEAVELIKKFDRLVAFCRLNSFYNVTYPRLLILRERFDAKLQKIPEQLRPKSRLTEPVPPAASAIDYLNRDTARKIENAEERGQRILDSKDIRALSRVNLQAHYLFANRLTEKGMGQLFEAISHNKWNKILKIVQKSPQLILMKIGVDLVGSHVISNVQSKIAMSPLEYACFTGNRNLLRLFYNTLKDENEGEFYNIASRYAPKLVEPEASDGKNEFSKLVEQWLQKGNFDNMGEEKDSARWKCAHSETLFVTGNSNRYPLSNRNLYNLEKVNQYGITYLHLFNFLLEQVHKLSAQQNCFSMQPFYWVYETLFSLHDRLHKDNLVSLNKLDEFLEKVVHFSQDYLLTHDRYDRMCAYSRREDAADKSWTKTSAFPENIPQQKDSLGHPLLVRGPGRAEICPDIKYINIADLKHDLATFRHLDEVMRLDVRELCDQRYSLIREKLIGDLKSYADTSLSRHSDRALALIELVKHKEIPLRIIMNLVQHQLDKMSGNDVRNIQFTDLLSHNECDAKEHPKIENAIKILNRSPRTTAKNVFHALSNIGSPSFLDILQDFQKEYNQLLNGDLKVSDRLR